MPRMRTEGPRPLLILAVGAIFKVRHNRLGNGYSLRDLLTAFGVFP